MGIVFTRLFSSLFGNKEARILVLGLDNAGKTTILYRLQMGEVVSTIPTIGFNVETVQYNNIKFQVWDLGGQTSIRPYWRCYFPNTQAIIYVVDSSDTDRLVVAKEEFHAILEEEELKGAVVLIFANKQDLPGAFDDAAVTESLELHKIKNRQWAIFKTSAIKGEGLFEGLDWLKKKLLGRGKNSRLNQLSAVSGQDPKDANGGEENNYLQNLSSSALERLQLHMQLQNPFSFYNNPVFWPKLNPLQDKIVQNLPFLNESNQSNLIQGTPISPQQAAVECRTISNLKADENKNSVNETNIQGSNFVGQFNFTGIEPLSGFTQAELDDLLNNEAADFLPTQSQKIAEFDCFKDMNGSMYNLGWWSNDFVDANSASSQSWDSSF
ncbi:unnamed protein product [Fraxinus pennsylvanica]|uniref:ADP-ribosylation factor 1 n=1 Tax=Fraxinus pennsylvanica TaxID=56036 RepID=A0AAD1Z1H0_9LAMI|nr:unnamed protein product [Fraxinus pennsylvanica]